MKRLFVMMFIAPVILMACSNQDTLENKQDEQSAESHDEEHQEVNAMIESDVLVDLKNADGQVVATASLVETEDTGVNIAIKGENLPPGAHGFHIHENGSCEAPDFESAGGHFNPTGDNHGFDDPDGRHAGDLENLKVAENGKIYTEVRADMVTLEKGKENSLLNEDGTSLVIHAEADDYKSQPSGNAGERIACGVIE
ncbi:superoxide dismutase family protein [Oceanobacillus salinisoli]|uniref:superoxide dismutase family protein n=1 Tax=Oceanobacillus salinisoli TaxID=2678611 RepID=UPI0012E1CF10|nr:superoxide dismutase family protein [Oceanobacillus salinisoli]